MEQTYTYYGPLSAVTLPADDDHPKGRQVQFIRGGQVTLPDDNDYVKSLEARGFLVPVAATAAETKMASDKAATEPSSVAAATGNTASTPTATDSSKSTTATTTETTSVEDASPVTSSTSTGA